MLSHFMPHPRPDEDITDIDRFFEGQNPESVDPGDFYADKAQIIWCSLLGYLRILRALGFSQQFVRTETILALCDLHIGSEYPNLISGIAREVNGSLDDGFDIESFLNHYASSEHPDPLTKEWRSRQGGLFVKSRLFGHE